MKVGSQISIGQRFISLGWIEARGNPPSEKYKNTTKQKVNNS
jgi:hypothetical protein